MNLPNTFEEKMKHLLGEEYEDYLKCYEEPRHYGLRVNTNKISVEDFLKIAPWPLRPVPWISNGFYYDGDQIQPAKHPYYFAGLYYLQEPSAMTPADRLLIEPGDRVLDVCAAPGGKATELGAKLQGKGVLMANDISNSRAKGLLKNIELFGIGNMLVLSEEHGPEFFSKIQRSIITQAASMLRPGGMMLYSTCTFDPSENEQTIEYLLEEYPEFEICEMAGYEGFAPGMPEVTDSKNPNLAKTVRIFPHRMEGEGHYLALLKKGEGSPIALKEKDSKKGGKLPEELEEFFRNVSWKPEASRLDIHGERVYYMPKGLPKLNGVRFLRTGLLLGELKKKRFEPSQAFAMSLKKEEYANILDLSVQDERVIKYLKGETLDVEDLVSRKEKGWYLVCVDGYPLGFGKLANQTLKNKYLPGWRWQS